MLRDVRLRIVVTCLLLVAIALASTGWTFYSMAWHQGVGQARLRIAGRAVELERFVEAFHENYPDLSNLVNQYMFISPPSTDGIELRVLDTSGKQVHPRRGRPPTPTELFRICQKKRASGDFWTSEEARGERLHQSMPLSVRGQLLGYADLSVSLAEVRSATRRIEIIVVVAGAFLTVLGLAMSFWVARRILEPVEKVRSMAARVAGGELSVRLPDMGEDEVGELGRMVNALAVDLQRNLNQVTDEKNKLDSILSNMVDGVVTVRQNGVITFANFTAARIVADWRNEQQAPEDGARAADAAKGAPRVEAVEAAEGGEEARPGGDPPDARDQRLMNRNLFEVLQPAPVQEILETALGTGTALSREVSLGEKFFTVFAIPLVDPTSEEESHERNVLVLLRDVTSLRQLETARNQFLGNVSHELKTPLTIIKGFVITLLKSPGMTDEWKRYLEFIDRESDRLARLVDDILNLARLRSKRTQMSFGFCEPTELLKETFRQMQPQAVKYEAELVFDCPPSLPVLLADSDRFKEIVINLVDNAFKYTPPRGKVELSARATPEHLKIKVRDTGPGIPQEELPFLFERFFRGSQTGGRKSGGTGIGLAIVKEIVDMHRGTIDVESRAGYGTTFTVSLPLRQSGRRSSDDASSSPTRAPL